MEQLPDNLSGRDIHLWLSGTFFAAGDGVLRYFEVSPDGSLVRAEDSEGRIVDVRPGQVLIHWPRCGAVNLPEGALYVQRRPVRQYRRSYAAGRCTITVPGSGWLPRDCVLGRYRPSSWPLVLALFDPRYPPDLDTAMEELDKVPSVALSPALTLVKAEDVVILYHALDAVGMFRDGNFVQDCSARMMKRLSKMTGGQI